VLAEARALGLELIEVGRLPLRHQPRTIFAGRRGS
jgi:hypothetical protein